MTIMLLCALTIKAQSNIVTELQRDVQGQGTVRVMQPAKLIELMGSMAKNNGKVAQVEGYRVMVYSGNNSRTARDEANKMAKYMRDNFPGAQVYVVFESPIRSCLYGDYRTREEAEAVMYRLKATKKFKEISVKKCLINLPY
ncbi:MAG: SPOR domain-containing protein [Bacteroidaceae bacterium]|nr:SPOR domain-containing protein [Bacteroidaceae bacterium]MBQ3189141.1 SPOR domain-containing protein [Bacteroidaceae bacterium]MBQ3622615.1 SPOR domain-containing protein [Bacteroidaceae bacterium]MBR7135325.1 SPOR domain-containing protein [Bacteroidaceae bacterium]